MRRTIGVLSGGGSPERDVSLLSGQEVSRSLARQRCSVRPIVINSLDDLVPRLVGVDVVFNCLHGGPGEDGTVRLLLDVMGIPSIGSGALACARAMDKAQSKALFRAAGLPTPMGLCTEAQTPHELALMAQETLTFPLVIKPQSGGSTIGVHLVHDAQALEAVATDIGSTFGPVLAEEYIPGREVTVGILHIDGEDQPLPVIEIRYPNVLFDYQAKYEPGRATFLAPAPLSKAVSLQIQTVALQAHQTLGCWGFSRVDLRLHEDGTPYILEVNTLPGMTPMSDLPRAAAVHGIDYDRLVERMLLTSWLG